MVHVYIKLVFLWEQNNKFPSGRKGLNMFWIVLDVLPVQLLGNIFKNCLPIPRFIVVPLPRNHMHIHAKKACSRYIYNLNVLKFIKIFQNLWKLQRFCNSIAVDKCSFSMRSRRWGLIWLFRRCVLDALKAFDTVAKLFQSIPHL